MPDARAAKDDLVRIVDESGHDYLFDRAQFAFVDFPQAVRKKIALAIASHGGNMTAARPGRAMRAPIAARRP